MHRVSDNQTTCATRKKLKAAILRRTSELIVVLKYEIWSLGGAKKIKEGN
ncbi:hypothetical protein RO3G_03446 [Rhizopus delemar RA 99-880]|uniref:Uncharacterized protein n=1 Tax=Rhizopus delemar (strain RA 99-880 / ATCC MYA-4621 / FGSC 9543 / NRRL 43880) TaxID=246409 RepID=I1BRB1_RHIO9|nr:hypothetical protein RO3G_03446 [Rhizopus delemar RA 99-880]|eukprot:EIE78741.1 hypothetical protein RO3G_03446 [Rhizopus delemar RA 99-880]